MGALSKNKIVQRSGVLILSFKVLGVYVILRFGFSFKRLRSGSHYPSRSPRFSVTTNITEFILAFKLSPVVCLDSPDFTTKWKNLAEIYDLVFSKKGRGEEEEHSKVFPFLCTVTLLTFQPT